MGEKHLAIAIAELVGAMFPGFAAASLRAGKERGHMAGPGAYRMILAALAFRQPRDHAPAPMAAHAG